MNKSSFPPAIPATEMPKQLSSKNLELRLLPYWKGVKHFRTSTISQYMTPQDYYWVIVANNKNPTLVNGKIASFNSRADIYFSRIPPHVTAKLWRNFGLHPKSVVSSR